MKIISKFFKMKNHRKGYYPLLLLSFFWLSNAYCQTNELVGVGLHTCAQFMSTRRTQDKFSELLYVSWVQGQLTTFNLIRGQAKEPLVNIPEPQTLLLMLERQCMDEPRLNVMFAASSLFKRIEK